MRASYYNPRYQAALAVGLSAPFVARRSKLVGWRKTHVHKVLVTRDVLAHGYVRHPGHRRCMTGLH